VDTYARSALPLVLLALVARIGGALTIGNDFHFPDEAVYVDAARRLAEGAGFDIHYPNVPAYPVVLALLTLGLSPGLLFFRIGQAAVASLGCLAVFALADRLFGRRVAMLAGLVYALDPLLVLSSGLLYPETIAAVLVPIVVLAAFDGAERDRLSRSALAGGLLGILALLRPVALILPPIAAGWIIVMASGGWRRRLAHVAVLGLAFLLVLAPWTIRNARVHGQFVPVATAGTDVAPVAGEKVAREGLVLSMARYAWSEPAALSSKIARQFVQFWELIPTRMMTDDPARREEFNRLDRRLSVEPLFSQALRDWVSALSFGLELALALVGLVLATPGRWRRASLPVALTLGYAVGYSMFVAKLRYRIPVLPLLFLFTGAGAAVVLSLARRTAGRAETTDP
jgi:hypothetical protein